MLNQQFLSFILKLIILLFKIIVSKVCIINKFVLVDVNLGLDLFFFNWLFNSIIIPLLWSLKEKNIEHFCFP